MLNGDAGNDQLNGGQGDDILDGGEGTDVAIFSANFSEYTITYLANGTVSISHNSGTDGIDTLTNIEIACFADGDVALTGNPLTELVDTYTGTGGNDTLIGRGGNDRLAVLAMT